MRKRRMKWIVLLIAGTACSVHHAAIDLSKLDPAFAALVASQKGHATSTTSHHPQPTEGRTTPGAAPELRYDCIVYTKQAGVLRKKGIVIRSELPDFVTAWASLKQIEQMASLPEVTYIEAPKTSYPNRQENQLR